MDFPTVTLNSDGIPVCAPVDRIGSVVRVIFVSIAGQTEEEAKNYKFKQYNAMGRFFRFQEWVDHKEVHHMPMGPEGQWLVESHYFIPKLRAFDPAIHQEVENLIDPGL